MGQGREALLGVDGPGMPAFSPRSMGSAECRATRLKPQSANGWPIQQYSRRGLKLEQKHIPEIRHYSGLTARSIFTLSVGNFRRGMVGQRAVEARRSAGQAETGDVSAVFNKGQKHFSIKDSEDTMRIEPESMNGINDIEIHVFAALARRQALLIAKFDNLGKGASEVAVQNLMLMPGR